MKKNVTKLKKKHRDYIWRDEEGDYWYWDTIKETWCAILGDMEGGFHINDRFDPIHYHWFERIAESSAAAYRRGDSRRGMD